MTSRYLFIAAAALAACGGPRPATPASTATAADPLPGWNEGPAKRAIVAFVRAAVADTGSGRVAPADRVAVFDNDGTLWAEQPIYFQLQFALDRVKAMATEQPGWRTTEPFRSVLAGDPRGLLEGGEKGVLQLVAATHAGMTTEEFGRAVTEWAGTARHPRTGRLYTEMVYQPMRELLTYLRANGFRTWIVSGGGQEFMRAWVGPVYGIPPEQVVGSHGELAFELRDGTPVLVKQPQVVLVDDHAGKPVGIQRFIGRRPVFAFGNSDGDLEMLQWTAAGEGPRFAAILHHTDADREWAYDRDSRVGRLDKALDEATARSWTVVDMKTEWNRVFSFEP